MTDFRPLAVAAVISIAAIVVATVAVVRAERAPQAWRPTSMPTSMPASMPTSQPTSQPTSRPKLPDGLTLLPPSDDVTVRGAVMCGKCALYLGTACNVVIHDEENGHLIMVLANEQLRELEKLTGT